MPKIALSPYAFVLSMATVPIVSCMYDGEKGYGPTDLIEPLHLIERVQSAERDCHVALGHYASLKEAHASNCGNLDRIVSDSTAAGFVIELEADSGTYTVRVKPIKASGPVNLYSDQTEVVRVGTPTYPATRESPAVKR